MHCALQLATPSECASPCSDPLRDTYNQSIGSRISSQLQLVSLDWLLHRSVTVSATVDLWLLHGVGFEGYR